jgi:hypothetical protein
MKLELLRIAGCPNTKATRRLLNDTLREMGLSEEIQEIEVSDSSQAEALSFPGSPTILIDGVDAEPGLARGTSNGLSCRIYMIDGNRHTAPTQEMIRRAIGSALSPADRGQESMKHTEKITPAAAVVSALSTLTCCLPSTIAAAAGSGGLGLLMEPLRPWLLALSIGLLGLGLVQLYRTSRTCHQRSPVSIAVFVISAMLVLGVLVFPQSTAGLFASVIP